MKLIASRIIPFIDCDSLQERTARETLFRQQDGAFILYLSDTGSSRDADERVIFLDSRNALIWLGESAEACGSFWT